MEDRIQRGEKQLEEILLAWGMLNLGHFLDIWVEVTRLVSGRYGSGARERLALGTES